MAWLLFDLRNCPMKSTVFRAFSVVSAAALALDCSANPLVVGREIDAGDDRCCFNFPDAGIDRDGGDADAGARSKDGGSNDGGGACSSAGGTCVPSNVACAKNAPAGGQDCDDPPSAGGAFCCLALSDAGAGRDAADVDGGKQDGGSKDGGDAGACASAGGTCINGTVACGKDAPVTAQDCPLSTAGSFCCLTPL
jgi:hypothetical protein